MSELKVNTPKEPFTQRLRRVGSQLLDWKDKLAAANIAKDPKTPTDLGSHPPNPPPSHPIKLSRDPVPKDKILAFRSITKMLSLAQSNRLQQIPAESNPHLSESEQLELSICSAFATVAVVEHEVVAVITDRRGKETLKVIVSFHSDRISSAKSLVTSPTKIKTKILHLIFSAASNTRREAAHDSPPTIDPAEIPPGCDSKDDREIRQYAAGYRSMTMSQHLWVLSKLLSMHKNYVNAKAPASNEDMPAASSKDTATASSNYIISYVIATCYRKIRNRMNHPLSVTYLRCFDEIKTFNFDLSMAHEAPTKVQYRNDRLFMSDYLLVCKSLLPNIQVDKLEQQAHLARKDDPYQLYTEETCIQFHLLFVAILRAFKAALDTMEAERKNSNSSTTASNTFKQAVLIAMLHGYGLQRLGKGAALRMHLKNISGLLHANISLKKKTPTDDEPDDKPLTKKEQKEKEKEEQQKEEQQANLDSEFAGVRPFSNREGEGPIPLWLSCIEWVRLVVNHFEAVDILLKFVTGPAFTQNNIFVEIVAAPTADNKFLHWAQLFTDPTLVPALVIPKTVKKSPKSQGSSDAQGSSNAQAAGGDDISNDELLLFLREAVNQSGSIRQASAAWKNRNIVALKNLLKKAKNSQHLSAFSKRVGTVLTDIRSWEQSPNEALSDKITLDLTSLTEAVQLYTFMSNPTPANFSGALHCETILASLLDPATATEDSSAEMKGFGPVIGVSKRCCPACHYFVTILLAEHKHIIRSAHKTVSICTLPEWLSEANVDSMNAHFGGLLRQEFLALKKASTVIRPRAQSTGSSRLSFDSTEACHFNFETALATLLSNGYIMEEVDSDSESSES